MTVSELLNFIEKHNIPHDSEIFSQRVEDRYYQGITLPSGQKTEGWETVKKVQDITGETEYSPVWCAVKYKDDNRLFLDLHY